jgi:hypothetical protein
MIASRTFSIVLALCPHALNNRIPKFHSSNNSANGFSVFAQTGGKVTAVADHLFLSNVLNIALELLIIEKKAEILSVVACPSQREYQSRMPSRDMGTKKETRRDNAGGSVDSDASG